MKIQLKALNEIKGSLAKLVTAQGVPGRVCYRATKFSKKVTAELSSLEEVRGELVKKFGEKMGERVIVTEKNGDAFLEAFEQVLQEEIELPDIKFKAADLENAGLTMLDYANLDFMIVDEDPTERK